MLRHPWAEPFADGRGEVTCRTLLGHRAPASGIPGPQQSQQGGGQVSGGAGPRDAQGPAAGAKSGDSGKRHEEAARKRGNYGPRTPGDLSWHLPAPCPRADAKGPDQAQLLEARHRGWKTARILKTKSKIWEQLLGEEKAPLHRGRPLSAGPLEGSFVVFSQSAGSCSCRNRESAASPSVVAAVFVMSRCG